MSELFARRIAEAIVDRFVDGDPVGLLADDYAPYLPAFGGPLSRHVEGYIRSEISRLRAERDKLRKVEDPKHG